MPAASPYSHANKRVFARIFPVRFPPKCGPLIHVNAAHKGRTYKRTVSNPPCLQLGAGAFARTPGSFFVGPGRRGRNSPTAVPDTVVRPHNHSTAQARPA